MRRLASPRLLLLVLVPLAVLGARYRYCLPEPWRVDYDNVLEVQAGPNFEFQFRVASLIATPGTIIQLPPGRHEMAGTITIESSHVIVRGAGMVLPKTVFTDANGNGLPDAGENECVRGEPDASGWAPCLYETLCPGSTTEHCGTILDFKDQFLGSQGILALGDHFTIEHLSILNTIGDGVKTQDITGQRFYFVHVAWPDVKNLLDHGAYGLYPAKGFDVRIFGCDVRGVRDAGIYVGQSDNIVVEYNNVQENVIGIELENTKNGEIRYNTAHGNTAGIAVFDLPNLEESYGTRVYGNRIFDNDTENFAAGGIISLLPPGTGLIVIGSKDVEIFRNDISGNDTVNAVVASFQISLEPIDDLDYDPYTSKVFLHDNRFGAGSSAPKQFGAIVQSFFTGYCNSLSLPEAEAHPGCRVLDPCPPGSSCVAPILPDIVFGGWANPAKLLPDCGTVGPDEPCAPAGVQPRLLALEPQFRNCARDNVTYAGEPVLVGMLNGYEPVPAGVDLYDASYFDCAQPSRLPVLVPPPTVPPDVDAGLTDEERDALCEDVGGDPADVNWDAYVANCPDFDQYRLFADGDPRGNPQGGGFKYELTSPLFSDHARKDRYVFLPPDGSGQRQPMAYSADDVFELPVGTIISKAFSFQDANLGTDVIAEVRLLIHRPTGWEGLPFVRNQTTGAYELSIAGGLLEGVSVSDPSGVSHAFDYPIPDMAQCGTCHVGPTGDDPIGLKARLLNRDLGGGNQLVGYVADGILVDGAFDALPASPQPADFDRIPFPFDPTDGSVEDRAMGYLETNCAHCHNGAGRAGFTSLHLTWMHPVDVNYGVCKRPIAAGGGAFTDEFGARVDIEPGDAGRSILWRRMESDDPAKMMPELARVLVHQEGLDLMAEWIDVDLAGRAGECDLLEGPGGGE